MTRSSRHKSHKQSKRSSKEAIDYNSESEGDVRMKERSSNKEAGGSGRVSKDSASGEKRKYSSHEKDGKDLSGQGNGDASEEYVSSKRRREKVDDGSGSDRWDGGGDELVDVVGPDKVMKVESSRIDLGKGLKSKESKGSGDSKGRSSKRHESAGEKEERNMSSIVEKEVGRGESKRNSEKQSARKEGKESKEVKEKERGSDRDKKGQEIKQGLDVRAANGDVVKKQGSQLEDAVEGRAGKRGRENTGNVT